MLPASAAPMARIAASSSAQTRPKSLKSWSNAVCTTASAAAAPRARLAVSSSVPRTGSAPIAATAAAPVSERVSPSTWCPAPINPRTTADPTNPVAPVTKTRIAQLRMT